MSALTRCVVRVEPHAQELRDAAGLAAVVERHHHDAEEHHRRDGADPVVVHRRDAVLGAVGRHPDQLDRAEVRRDERQARHPRGQRAPRQQEVQAGRHRSSCRHPDAEHQHEVEGHEHVVDRGGVQPQVGLRQQHFCRPPAEPSRGMIRLAGGSRHGWRGVATYPCCREPGLEGLRVAAAVGFLAVHPEGLHRLVAAAQVELDGLGLAGARLQHHAAPPAARAVRSRSASSARAYPRPRWAAAT